ncbi:MAG: helix-turn-helix domain-containing protein [Isosphaeraceae bacterium]|nr:helix-turn-helix domain-containing protein [Isosphaeraceae bacterium]
MTPADRAALVYRTIQESPQALTEPELVERTGLSRTAVKGTLRALLADGRIEAVLVARGTAVGDTRGWMVRVTRRG